MAISVEAKNNIKIFNERDTYHQFEGNRYQAPERNGIRPREFSGTALANMRMVVEGIHGEIVAMQPEGIQGTKDGKAFLPEVFPAIEQNVQKRESRYVTVLVPRVGIDKNQKI